MKMRHWMLAGAIALTASGAQAADLFVFGDSLTDSGNADAGLRATGQPTRTPAAEGYFENRFSNGYNFADFLSFRLEGKPATAFGVPFTPFFYGGDNFSVGGAQAREVAGDASPSFAEQLTTFQFSGKTFTSDDYVLVTFGGNDIQQELLQVVANPLYSPSFAATTAALTAGLTSLLASGAQNVIVTGQADIGQIPRVTNFGAGASALGTGLSIALNDIFRTVTDSVQQASGRNVQFFDLLAFQQNLLAPGNNPFTNTTTPCQASPAALAANCPGYLYLDQIHPTTAAHRRIADAIASQLGVPAVPEPATWATMMLGFGLVGIAARRRRRLAAA